MRKLLLILAMLAIPVSGWGATYYVSPTGDGSDGLTWAKAYTTIQAAINAHGTTGVTIEIDGGTEGITYNAQVTTNVAGFTGAIIQGSSEAGHNGTVSISGLGINGSLFTANKTTTINRLTLRDTPSGGYNALASSGADVLVTLNNVTFDNNAQEMSVSAAMGTTFNYCRIIGRTSNPQSRSSYISGPATFNYCIIENLDKGWSVRGPGTIAVNNTLITGTRNTDVILIENNNSQILNVKNSIIGGSELATGYTINENTSNGVANVWNSILLPAPLSVGAKLTNGTVNDNGSNIGLVEGNAWPKFTSTRRPFILVFGVDDTSSVATWRILAPKLAAHGWGGTWAISNRDINFTSYSELQGFIDAGHEIATHTYNHTNLTNLQALKIRYVGAEAACTMTIADNTLTTSQGASWNLNSYAQVSDLITAIDDNTDYTATATGLATYSNAGEATTLADIADQDIKTADYIVLQDATKYYDYELTTAKEGLEANLTGYTVKSVVYPGNYSDNTARTAIIDRGLLGARQGSDGFYKLETGVDVFKVRGYQTDALLGTTKVKVNMASFIEYMGYTGGVAFIYTHDLATFTATMWDDMLSVVAASGAEVMTFAQAVAHITNVSTGILPTGGSADNITWTRDGANGSSVFTDASDYTLQSGSPAINAGVDVGLTTDYAGNPIVGLPDIGAYEYQPPATPRFPNFITFPSFPSWR